MARKPASTKKLVDKSRATRRLRIASYNINGITSRLEILLRWLGEFQPDIVALQELRRSTNDSRKRSWRAPVMRASGTARKAGTGWRS